MISNEILTKNATNTPLLIIILADLAAGTLCGLWNGLLVSRARIQPMVATLILMVAGRGIAQLITNGQIMTIYYKPYFWFGNGYILGLPVSIYIVAVVFILAWILVRKTAIGLFIESVESTPNRLSIAASTNKTSNCWPMPSAGFVARSPG